MSVSFLARSQSVWMDEALAIGYNRADGIYGDNISLVGYDSDLFSVKGGVGLNLTSDAGERPTAAGLSADYYFAGSGGHRFGAGLFATGRWQSLNEYNAGVLTSWAYGRLEARAGTFFKWFTRGGSTVTEPFNFAYSISATIFPEDRTFNMGLSLSNLDDLEAERFYCPLLTLKFTYAIPGGYVYLSLREHSSGTFDLTSNFFDHRIRFGAVYIW